MRNLDLNKKLVGVLAFFRRCASVAKNIHPRWKFVASLLLALAARPALAEDGESTVDKIADVITVMVLFVVPTLGVALFLMVHVLPEKFAERRHHPQREAITTLCFLSLLFGGLLWPLAWLWTFTKPVGYRAAYGTDKHNDYYEEMAEKHSKGELLKDEMSHLREDLESMESKGPLPPNLKSLKLALGANNGHQTPPTEPAPPVPPAQPKMPGPTPIEGGTA